MTPNKKILIVTAGFERIDLLAKQALGTPLNYKKLMRANPLLDIWNIKANQKLEIPNG